MFLEHLTPGKIFVDSGANNAKELLPSIYWHINVEIIINKSVTSTVMLIVLVSTI